MHGQQFWSRGRHTIYVMMSSHLVSYKMLHVHSVAILLGHLKLPFEKIKAAILGCDDTVFSEQHLRQMEAFAPDKKEVKNISTYTVALTVLFLSVLVLHVSMTTHRYSAMQIDFPMR